jgi:hypothetical protein
MNVVALQVLLLLCLDFFGSAEANFTKQRIFDKSENTDLASWTAAPLKIAQNARCVLKLYSYSLFHNYITEMFSKDHLLKNSIYK